MQKALTQSIYRKFHIYRMNNKNYLRFSKEYLLKFTFKKGKLKKK